MFKRESGILLHPTSLPGRFGVGDLGPSALRWVKLLTEAQQKLWQILPLSPVGNGFSPYHCTSSLAGNTLLLSLERLQERGYLHEEELARCAIGDGNIQPELVLAKKPALLLEAARRFIDAARGESRDGFEHFKANQADWLQDFARFEVMGWKGHGLWTTWPQDLRSRHPDALQALDRDLGEEIELSKALQFLFEEQWQSVRRLANLKHIRVIGDLPIFVSLHSADVWANQHLFRLRPDGSPDVVAGVPPDYFSESGQRWGNPLYDWNAHEAEGFRWWIRRISRSFELTDILRIDHFRGFAACWEIPAEEPTAINGHWEPSPGYALFEAVRAALGSDLPIIAEDLGIITDDVVELREHFGFPTMRVLQFSFGGEPKLLPHNYPRNCVAYTGTHDNETMVQWYESDPVTNGIATAEQVEAQRDHFRRYYSTDGSNVNWTGIHRLMAAHTDAVIYPFQDILGLGAEGRMNTPGTMGEHNWTWRFRWEQVSPHMLETLRVITRETDRNAE